MKPVKDIDPSVKKWVKWVVALLILRRDRPLQWSSFLALNPVIKKLLAKNKAFQMKSGTSKEVSEFNENQDRKLYKLANLISSGIFFTAIIDNPAIPADYGIVYIFSSYMAELNPPSHSQILVSPNSSKYFKLSYYQSNKLRQLYNHKHFIIFPLLVAQILSNYLTPTRLKLNQRYLSSLIKTRILNPIWINYTLAIDHHSINWLQLLKSYCVHNAVFMGFYGLTNVKKRLLDHYYEMKHNVYNANDFKSFKQVVINYFWYVFHRANSITNFIYLPNLTAIFLISLTSPMIKYINKSDHQKNYFKAYVKVIGVLSGLVTLMANSLDLIPAFKYKLTSYDDVNIHDTENIRRISDTFVNALNLYLIKLIILQKWRIIKENHPRFKLIKLQSWNRLEVLIFCFGIYKLMNLNDFLKRTSGKDYGLRDNSLIKMIDRVM